MLASVAALPVALAGCSALGDREDATVVWSTQAETEAADSFTAGFSRPSGTSHGECDVWESDAAAFYRWGESAVDGDPTRCYPVHLFASEGDDDAWTSPIEGAWRFSGQFWVDLEGDAKDQLTSGLTFSLLTFLPSPPQDTSEGANKWLSSTTVNLEWSEELGAPQLNVWHVPGQGQGDFERKERRAFPLGQWVQIDVTWGEDGSIAVLQDGDLVIEARKERFELAGGGQERLTGARLYGFHAGGYASASITDWTIGNSDFVLESLG